MNEHGQGLTPLARDAHRRHQRQVWSTGDYDAMARQYEDAAEGLVARVAITPGMRVLDIATGTGNAAIAAARAGATVIGLDLTPELFDDAQARADEFGLHVQWREGDAEALPYADATFDRVLSAFGMMFVPNGRLAATEMVRVLRPGGRFGLCNWVFRGVASTVLEAFDEEDFPGLAAARPTQWGDPESVRELFADLHVDLSFATGAVSWMFASPEEGVRWLEEVSGPVIAARAALEMRGRWQEYRARLIRTLEDLVRDDVGGLWVQADYLVALGRRLPARSFR